MALQADSIADLLVATLRKLGRFKWTDAAATLQRYVAFTELMKKNKVGFSDGYGLQWQVMVRQSNTARMTGLYAIDVLNVGDVMKSCTLPWRHLTNNFAYDRREMSMNGGESRIYDVIKTRRYDCWLGTAEKLETQFWSLPSVGGDDMHGVPYWIVKNATEGFNGGNPTGYSDVAGLSRSTYSGLKNYTAQFTAIDDTFMNQLSDASDKTNFTPPVDYPDYGQGGGFGYYTTLENRRKLKRRLEQQNDNLGDDLDSKNGKVTYRGTRVSWVPKLDSDTDKPFYGINWNWFRPVFLEGEYMREDGPRVKGDQHTTYTFFVDLSANMECRNTREQFVLATGTTGSVS